MAFFDVTESGEITARFSRDVDEVDNRLVRAHMRYFALPSQPTLLLFTHHVSLHLRSNRFVVVRFSGRCILGISLAHMVA